MSMPQKGELKSLLIEFPSILPIPWCLVYGKFHALKKRLSLPLLEGISRSFKVPATGCLSQSPSRKDGSAAKSCCGLHERVRSPWLPGGFKGLGFREELEEHKSNRCVSSLSFKHIFCFLFLFLFLCVCLRLRMKTMCLSYEHRGPCHRNHSFANDLGHDIRKETRQPETAIFVGEWNHKLVIDMIRHYMGIKCISMVPGPQNSWYMDTSGQITIIH